MKTIRGYLLAWLIGGMLLCTFIAGVLLYNVVRAENRQLFNNQLKHIAGSLLIHLPPLTPSLASQAPTKAMPRMTASWCRSGTPAAS